MWKFRKVGFSTSVSARLQADGVVEAGTDAEGQSAMSVTPLHSKIWTETGTKGQ